MTGYDTFVVLSERFREREDYVEGLLAMTRQLDLSIRDLDEAIRHAHPLPNWDMGSAYEIASFLDLRLTSTVVKEHILKRQILEDKALQKVLHGCFFALRSSYDKGWDEKKASGYLTRLYGIFRWMDLDFGDSRGTIQSFVRHCGLELDEKAVRFTLRQMADSDEEFASLLVIGMIDRIGPIKVWRAYEASEAASLSGNASGDTNDEIEQFLRRLLSLPDLENDAGLRRAAREAVLSAITRLGMERTKKIVEELRPLMFGEFLPSYSEHTLGKRVDL